MTIAVDCALNNNQSAKSSVTLSLSRSLSLTLFLFLSLSLSLSHSLTHSLSLSLCLSLSLSLSLPPLSLSLSLSLSLFRKGIADEKIHIFSLRFQSIKACPLRCNQEKVNIVLRALFTARRSTFLICASRFCSKVQLFFFHNNVVCGKLCTRLLV